mgnify:CR=1 FL=1
MTFDLQRFAREPEDIKYRGRRRWNGNHGKVWLNNSYLFEIEAFEAKVTMNREDVIISNSVDSKVTGLVGEGTITIKKVINRGFKDYLEEQKAGHDPRFTIVAALEDPDMIDSKKERIRIDNVWFDELEIMKFAKGEVVETEIPFKFTPEDLEYLESVTV